MIDLHVANRIIRDVTEIRTDPLYNQFFSLTAPDDTVTLWHVNMRGATGTYMEDCVFHLEINFPMDYPKSPPEVVLLSTFPHWHIFGTYICLDMLEKGEWSIESEKQEMYTGWSTAYCLSSVLVQLQSFFWDGCGGSASKTIVKRLIEEYRCYTCNHNKYNISPAIPEYRQIQVSDTPYFTTVTHMKSIIERMQLLDANLYLPEVDLDSVSLKDKILWRIQINFNSRESVDFRAVKSQNQLLGGKCSDGYGIFILEKFQYTTCSTKWDYIDSKTSAPIPVADFMVFSIDRKMGNTTMKKEFRISYNLHKKDPRRNETYQLVGQNEYAEYLVLHLNNQRIIQKVEIFYTAHASPVYNIQSGEYIPSDSDLFYFLPSDMLKLVLSFLRDNEDRWNLITTCKKFLKFANWNPLAIDRSKEQLICYYTKHRYEEEILGFGMKVEVKNKKIVSVFSPVELLSYKAFKYLDCKRSVWKLNFTDWFPAFINRAHGLRNTKHVKEFIRSVLSYPSFSPKYVIEVLPALMNSVVVSMMKNDVYVSFRALEGYFNFHRWFLHLAEEFPTITRYVNTQIEKFINMPKTRTKQNVPDLGQFLTYITITDEYSWEDIMYPYLEENFTRNVLWVLKKYKHLESERVSDTERLTCTFEASLTSLRLLMFQVSFFKLISKRSNKGIGYVKDLYDSLNGKPTEKMQKKFKSTVDEIMGIDNWRDFFDFIGCPIDQTRFSRMLIHCLHESTRLGYHTSFSKQNNQNRNHNGNHKQNNRRRGRR